MKKIISLFMLVMVCSGILACLPSVSATSSIIIDGGAASTMSLNVVLTLTSDHAKMSFSNDNISWSVYENVAASKAWTLAAGGTGVRTVYARFSSPPEPLGHGPEYYTDTITYIAPAGTLTLLSPSGTVGSPTIIPRSDPFNFSVKVTGFAGIGYYLYGVVSDGSRYYGECISNVSVTANGAYTVSFAGDQIPFDQKKLHVHMYLTNATSNPFSAALASDEAYFSVNGVAVAWTHMVSLRGFDPACYDLKALHVMHDGFQWSMTSNDTQTVYIFLCNADNRTLIAYGTRSVSYTNNGTLNSLDQGFTWHDYTGKTSYGNSSLYIPRSAYYEYIGVRTDDGSHSWANTRVTMLDDTGIGGDTREVNWSLSLGFSTDWSLKYTLHHNSLSSAAQFFGYFSYYETMPAPGETISGLGSQTKASWLLGINVYFVSMGMGWMMYMLGFIVVCCFVGPTYAFARKFNISVPNFIYVLMAVVGVTAAWVIGFFDTWVYVFFVILVMLALVIKYREPIEQAVGFASEEVSEFKAGEERIRKPFRTAVKEYGVKPIQRRISSRPGLKGFIRDEGSAPYIETAASIRDMYNYNRNLARAIGHAGQTHVERKPGWRYTTPKKTKKRGGFSGYYGTGFSKEGYERRLKGGKK